MTENAKKWLPWAAAGALALSCLVLVPVGVGIGHWMGRPPAGAIIIPRLPEVAPAPPAPEVAVSKRDLALMQAKETLTVACQSYALKHSGQLPDNLKQLLRKDAKGGPWLEDASALLDPWGQPFQYDRSGKRNNGRKPDIWTKSPDGIQIANWRED